MYLNNCLNRGARGGHRGRGNCLNRGERGGHRGRGIKRFSCYPTRLL